MKKNEREYRKHIGYEERDSSLSPFLRTRDDNGMPSKAYERLAIYSLIPRESATDMERSSPSNISVSLSEVSLPQRERTSPSPTGSTTSSGSATPSFHYLSSSPPPAPFSHVVASILLYSSVSLSIVFLNRRLFIVTFPYPIFVSWFQEVVGIVLFKLLSLGADSVSFLSPLRVLFPRVTLEWSKVIKVLPLSISFVGMISFANTCLKLVQVSTYQVARAATLLFNVILSRIILNMTISGNAADACSIVMFGFAIGALDPTTLSLLGVLTGTISSLFQAYYTVQIKNTLQHVDGDQNVMLYYNLVIASVVFVPIIFIGGETNVLEALPLDPNSDAFYITWAQLIASGILGVVLSMAAYWCVRVTSPVTFNVVGYSKACLQSVGGIIFLGDIVTFKSIASICITLGGSYWYSRVKMNENPAANAAREANLQIRLQSFEEVQESKKRGNSEDSED